MLIDIVDYIQSMINVIGVAVLLGMAVALAVIGLGSQGDISNDD